jgi:leader peptidase (prepilin peptidase)/N-methyltransferase
LIPIIIVAWIIAMLLIWGSFLNVVGYRLVHNESIVWPRSRCIHCKTPIKWYDTIPVISWIHLRGRCRTCKERISLLYPFIELLTVLIGLLALYYIPLCYLPAYGLLCSALIVTIRSDIETMLISSIVTLGLVPIGMLCSAFGYLPISFTQSVVGALLGYGCLLIIAKLFFTYTKKHGLGQGDLELMALIGSFLGPVGVWITLLIGSWTGALFGVAYILLSGSDRSIKLPFGPFLAIGAFVAIFWQHQIIMRVISWF